MPLMQWNDTFSVNIAEVDTQHKTLVSLINDLHFAITQGIGDAILKPLLARLILYAQTHFETEENYMKQYQYPAYSPHKVEHDAFVRRVLDFKAKFEKGQTVLSVEIMIFLNEWIFNHILYSDKKYSQFFNEHGLK
jgi:hemerythrin